MYLTKKTDNSVYNGVKREHDDSPEGVWASAGRSRGSASDNGNPPMRLRLRPPAPPVTMGKPPLRLRLRPPSPPVTIGNQPLRLRLRPPAPPVTMGNPPLRLRLRLRQDEAKADAG